MKYTLHTDGGSRNNPGPAGIGGIIHDENGSVVESFSKFIGTQTNNFAEYTAIEEGLKLAISLKIEELTCYLDSELAVKQINKIYKVKDETLKGIYLKVMNLSKSFKSIKFIHVRREFNKEADKLVNMALDKEAGII